AGRGRGPIVPAEGPSALSLLDRVIAAKGGLDALRGLKTIRAVARADITMPNGPLKTESTTYLQYPDHVRVETRLPDSTMIQVFDGVRAWIKDPAGVHDVPERDLRDLEGGLRRDTVAVLLAARDGALHTRLLPDVKDDTGKVRHTLEVTGTAL